MSRHRLTAYFAPMSDTKYEGVAYHAPFERCFDKTGKLLPTAIVGYEHALCGGWIWYVMLLPTNQPDSVKHVPANCSCCGVPLNGPMLAIEINNQLYFDYMMGMDYPADEGGHRPPVEQNPCAEIPLTEFPVGDIIAKFLPPGFLPPQPFDKKALDAQMDELRREFEKSLKHLDDLLNNPIFDVEYGDDDDEWKKGKS